MKMPIRIPGHPNSKPGLVTSLYFSSLFPLRRILGGSSDSVSEPVGVLKMGASSLFLFPSFLPFIHLCISSIVKKNFKTVGKIVFAYVGYMEGIHPKLESPPYKVFLQSFKQLISFLTYLLYLRRDSEQRRKCGWLHNLT